MHIEQIYTGCLAQGSYFITSGDEAVVIDPLREMQPYLERAERAGVKIKYILETHFHADFVSGHIDLAKTSGATIVYGPGAETAFPKHNAMDGEELEFGHSKIQVLHTPGHTPESTCYLLKDEEGDDYAIFTGDTLFIGDVGRPDLAQKATNLTKEDLAGWLYDSLRNKIMPLSDNIIVYPAHGAGSACGKNMSKDTWDTLGNQKATNYALRPDMTKQEFIREVTADLQPPPQYFAENAKLNKQGYKDINKVMAQGARAFSPQEFQVLIENPDILLLDVRSKEDFVKMHIPGAIFIGLDGSFAPWVGALVTNLQQKIVLITPEGREEEAVKRLARVGYDNALGYLAGGMKEWKRSGLDITELETINVEDFVNLRTEKKILDVRKPDEWATAHLVEAQHFPLDFINVHMSELNPEKEYILHCRSGYRSTVAASILRSRGYHKLVNVHGSFDVIKHSKRQVAGTCESLA